MDYALADTDYYRWILSAQEKVIFYYMTRMVLTKDNKYYPNGLLIVNAKIETIADKCGLSYGTTKDAVKKLNDIGAIVKLNKKAKNNRYLLGFLSNNNVRLYLLSHLAYKYANVLERKIFDQQEKLKLKLKQSISLNRMDYRLDSTYREHMIQYVDKPNYLFNELIDGRYLHELLFGKVQIFRKQLPRNVALGAIYAPLGR